MKLSYTKDGIKKSGHAVGVNGHALVVFGSATSDVGGFTSKKTEFVCRDEAEDECEWDDVYQRVIAKIAAKQYI